MVANGKVVMGSLQEELKKTIERLKLVHPMPEEEAPVVQKTSLAEQRKLAGIVEKVPQKEPAKKP